MMKTNIKSKKELLEKIKDMKIIETEHYRYIAEKVEQLDTWGDCYSMYYEIKRKKLEDINDPKVTNNDRWVSIYTEKIEDNFLYFEDGIF